MLYIYKYMYISVPNILSNVCLPPKVSTDLKILLNFDEFRIFNYFQQQILRFMMKDYKSLLYLSLILYIYLSNYICLNWRLSVTDPPRRLFWREFISF